VGPIKSSKSERWLYRNQVYQKLHILLPRINFNLLHPSKPSLFRQNKEKKKGKKKTNRDAEPFGWINNQRGGNFFPGRRVKSINQFSYPIKSCHFWGNHNKPIISYQFFFKKLILFFLIMGAGLIVLSFLDLAFGSKNLSCHACECDCVDFFLLGSVISLHAWGKLFDSLNNTGRPACYNYFSFREFFLFVLRYNTCLFTLLRIFHFSWKSFRKIKDKKNCWKLCLLVKAEAFYKYWHLMGKGHFFFFFFVYFGLPSFLGHWNTWILRCLCGLTCLFF
jgi:hypothetical protein